MNKKNLVILREGTNDIICLADDPAKKGISVSCYGKVLEPFMSRGRELVAEGKQKRKATNTKRRDRCRNLKMPSEPAISMFLQVIMKIIIRKLVYSKQFSQICAL